jgi:hypothetical protein
MPLTTLDLRNHNVRSALVGVYAVSSWPCPQAANRLNWTYIDRDSPDIGDTWQLGNADGSLYAKLATALRSALVRGDIAPAGAR